jgi:hypothetical protein
MKALFIVIGVVVIFGLLISTGAISGNLCVDNVGCIQSEGNGVKISHDTPNTTTVATPRP